MDNDFILVLGVLIGTFTVPAVINSFSHGRPPRSAVLFFVIGASLVSWAVYQQPSSYSVDGFPDLAIKVIANLF